MILTREIKIKISESNFSYYENLGYDISIGEKLVIPVELLSKGSNTKIKCKYDNKRGEYFCRKCSEKKRKESLKENWGCEYPLQNKKIMSKYKKTLVDKYGVDNISKRK